MIQKFNQYKEISENLKYHLDNSKPITENVFRPGSDSFYEVIKDYKSQNKDLFDKLTPIDMIEGLVMKRKNARLELGTSENNNTKSQLKCRKATKNYKY